MRLRWFATLHTSYKLYLVFPSLQVLKEMKETERRKEEQLEKTQTIQKTKIFIFGALEKKAGNDNVFLEVFEIF